MKKFIILLSSFVMLFSWNSTSASVDELLNLRSMNSLRELSKLNARFQSTTAFKEYYDMVYRQIYSRLEEHKTSTNPNRSNSFDNSWMLLSQTNDLEKLLESLQEDSASPEIRRSLFEMNGAIFNRFPCHICDRLVVGCGNMTSSTPSVFVQGIDSPEKDAPSLTRAYHNHLGMETICDNFAKSPTIVCSMDNIPTEKILEIRNNNGYFAIFVEENSLLPNELDSRLYSRDYIASRIKGCENLLKLMVNNGKIAKVIGSKLNRWGVKHIVDKCMSKDEFKACIDEFKTAHGFFVKQERILRPALSSRRPL